VSLDAPAVAIVEDVGRAGRDLVVVGTRERSAAARNLFGSTALRLLRRAPVAVWVARGDLGARPPTVVAAVALGDMAPSIVSAAARVAERSGGALHVVHVVDLGAEGALRTGHAGDELVEEYRRRRHARAASEVPRLVQDFAAGAHAKVHILTGEVNPTLVAAAAELGADVVVMGSVVHSAIGAVLGGLGRTAEHLLAHLRASMLVLKPS
jgi:nucleotide-binding universal stress UspA family protein